MTKSESIMPDASSIPVNTRNFFLSYGDLSKNTSFLYINKTDISTLLNNCEKYYCRGPFSRSESKYKINGIEITVYELGVHRALFAELPENPTQEQDALFTAMLDCAKQFIRTEYDIKTNNCVTAVAAVLHTLDHTITKTTRASPYKLDSELKTYEETENLGKGLESNVLQQFLRKYHQYERETSFFQPTPIWKKSILRSIDDIFHIDGQRMTPTIGAVLLKLGWVVEDNDKNLVATNKAPDEFKRALEKFNIELDDINALKNLYINNGGENKYVERIFETGSPDLKFITEKLHLRMDQKNDLAAKRALESYYKYGKETQKNSPEVISKARSTP